MYEQYYGFTRTPFRLESEPDMFFFGESQKNVLYSIKNALSLRKGLITLSGLPGSGKTTVMRRAIEESIVPDTVICRINRTRCNNFLETLKREIRARQKTKDAQSADLHQLVANAVQQKKHFLVVIDESQQLTEEEVDELFSLVSIEKDSRKHFKFLLVSHEPFHEYFDIGKYANSEELLSSHCYLLPLLHEEILPYIEHRLTNTGWKGTPSFSREIEYFVFLITQGIPRRINSFFDRLMLFSYFENNSDIDEDFVKSFCRDLLAELDAQPHPDLDSFDLRQALRREHRLFSESTDTDSRRSLAGGSKQESNILSNSTSLKGQVDEPLASDDPEELITFVSSFIKNPERYKNYTDQYYKIPKNLTLLLCLATETDQYIDDVTPSNLSSYSATEIKSMIAVFVEKMLITSRFDPHRILGLDIDANEDEINRHFSYMMRLCRSEYVKSNRSEFESVIKEAYIKLLSENKTNYNDIPVVSDILVAPKDVTPDVDDFDELKYREGADRKIADLENAKKLLNEVTSVKSGKTKNENSETIGHKQDKEDRENRGKEKEAIINDEAVINTTSNMPQSNKDNNKKSLVVPAALIGVAMAAGLGYVFFGSSLLSTPDAATKQFQPIATPVPENEKIEIKVNKKEEYPQIALLKKSELTKPEISNPEVKKSEIKKPDISATTIIKESTAEKIVKTEKVVKETPQEEIKQKEVEPKKSVLAIKSDEGKSLVGDLDGGIKSEKKAVAAKAAPLKTALKKENSEKKSVGFVKAMQVENTESDLDKAVTKAIDNSRKTNSVQDAQNQTSDSVASTKLPAKTEISSIVVKTGNAVSQLNNTQVDSQTTQAINSSLSAQVSTQAAADAKSTVLSKDVLNNIMANYKFTYETGNVRDLSDLFDEKAVTNEGFNRTQIIEDYELLFEQTDDRSLEFGEITWDQQENMAIGTGRFSLSADGDEPMEKQGKISIKVINVNEMAKIKQLFYLYQFAEVE